MKRILFAFAVISILMAACSKKSQITQCPSHINDSLQGSVVQVMEDMHVNGIVLVIDSAANLVVSAGFQDSLMGDAEVYSWLSMMLNPGNIFKPMLLVTILDSETLSQECLEKEYRCRRLCIDDVEISDHGDFVGYGRMDLRSALHNGSNVAFCDFINEIYRDADSRSVLSNNTTTKMIPPSVPFTINGLIDYIPQDFFRYCIGYGASLQPYTLAFYYHALVNHGRFRLIDEACSYRYENICSEQTAERVVDLLKEQTTGRIGVHGTLMDSTNSYPSYVGYSPDLKYTVMVMLHKSNTNVAMRVFDSIISQLR